MNMVVIYRPWRGADWSESWFEDNGAKLAPNKASPFRHRFRHREDNQAKSWERHALFVAAETGCCRMLKRDVAVLLAWSCRMLIAYCRARCEAMERRSTRRNCM